MIFSNTRYLIPECNVLVPGMGAVPGMAADDRVILQNIVSTILILKSKKLQLEAGSISLRSKEIADMRYCLLHPCIFSPLGNAQKEQL